MSAFGGYVLDQVASYPKFGQELGLEIPILAFFGGLGAIIFFSGLGQIVEGVTTAFRERSWRKEDRRRDMHYI